MSEAAAVDHNDLSGFDVSRAGRGSDSELALLMAQLETFLSATLPNLPEHLLPRLVDALNGRGALESSGEAVDYDAAYDMRNEMEMMLSTCRAMRNHVLDGDRVRDGIAFRDLKDFMTSVSSMMSTMMKNHEKLMTMDRHRAVEQATIQVLKEIGGEDTIDRFILLMEDKLSE
jgi:hypothetical protein